MKKILLFISILFFFNGCLSTEFNYSEKGMKFIKQTSSNFKKKFNLYLNVYAINDNLPNDKIGTKKIENFYLSFGSFEKLNIDEARKLLIDCSEYFLFLVNQDETIKKYLAEFPYTYKNLRIFIHFYDEKKDVIIDGNTSYCFLSNNIYICALNEKYPPRIKIEETYHEALEKVKSPKASASESLK